MKRILIVLAVFLGAQNIISAQGTENTTQPKLEVYYFHATMRCPTCLAIEEQTKKTLDENFAGELKSGIIKLTVLNLEEKENKALTEKFEIGWSSLILYVPESGKSVNLTEDAFAKARTNPEEFRAELQQKIKELL